MKVLLQPQITKSNHPQSKSNVYNTAPSNISKRDSVDSVDSVSFTGKEKALKGLAGEVVELLPRLKKGLVDCYSYAEGTEFAGMQKFRLEILDHNYVITRKTTTDRGFFGKEISNTDYYIHKNGTKNQHLKKEEYEKLVEELKEFASSTILKKHGYGNKSIAEILNDLGQAFCKGKATVKYSQFFQEEDRLLHGVSFKTFGKKEVFLIKTPKNEVYKIGFKNGSDYAMDVFPLTEEKEIGQVRNILKMNELANKKEEVETTKAKLKKEAQIAEENANDYALKSKKMLMDIDTELQELTKEFK